MPQAVARHGRHFSGVELSTVLEGKKMVKVNNLWFWDRGQFRHFKK